MIESRRHRALQALPPDLKHPAVLETIERALAEDLHPAADRNAVAAHPEAGDLTSVATLPSDLTWQGHVIAKQAGVVAGLPVAQAVFAWVHAEVSFRSHIRDGERVPAGATLATVSGPARALLTAERTALNLLGRLSGIATLTRRFVDAVAGTSAVILDTRKTAPGLRHLDKYAVRMGGGRNHRLGLYDMVLIKDNHIAAAGGITPAVTRVRRTVRDQVPIEVEVQTLDELREALALHPDRILLDNMSLEMLREAVQLTAGRVPLEASGNITLERVRAIAETGVDFISIGALTHSAPVLDVSLRV